MAWPQTPLRRRLKIGFATLGLRGREPAASVRAALQDSARLCESLGHQVVPAALPVHGEEFYRHFMAAWSAGAARALQMAQAAG